MNFKKLLAIGMLLLAMTSAEAFAVVDTEIVAPASASGSGTSFDATLRLTGPHKVGNFDLTVTFDPDLVQIDSIAAASGFTASPPSQAKIDAANTAGTGGTIALSFLDMTMAGVDTTSGQDTFIITFTKSADEGSLTLTPAGAIGEAPMGTDVVGQFTSATVELLATPPNPKVIATVSGSGDVTSDSGTATSTPGEKEYAVDAAPTYTLTPGSGNQVSAFTIDGINELSNLSCIDYVCTYTFSPLAEGASIALAVTFSAVPLPTITKTVGPNGSMTSDSGTSTANPNEKEYAVGATPIYTATPAQGYKVDTFTVDGTDKKGSLDCAAENNVCTYQFAALVAGANKTIGVTFVEVVKPTITVPTTIENGAISVDIGTDTGTPGEKEFSVGATPTYTLTPDNDYRVGTFTVDGVDQKATLTCNDTTNVCTYKFDALAEGATRTIGVTFESISYPKITVTQTGTGGAVVSDMGTETGTAGEKRYEIGDAPTYTLTPENGYRVGTFTVDSANEKANLTCDDATKVCTYTFTALAEGVTRAIGVAFEAIPYPKVTAIVTGTGGAIASDGGTETGTPGERQYEMGATPTYTLTPATGYEVDTFTVDDADKKASLTCDATTKVCTYTFVAFAEGEAHTIGVTFKQSNNPPIAGTGLTLSVAPGETGTGTLTATDQDDPADMPFAFALEDGTTGPKLTTKLGIVTITDAAAGTYTYKASSDAKDGDTDSFTFVVTDAKGGVCEQPGTVAISIVAPNEAPVAENGTLVASASAATQGTLVANDADGDTLTYSIVQNPTKGMVVLTDATTGAFTFNPFAGATGEDTFTFKANDGKVDSNTATMTLTFGNAYEATVTVTPATGGTAVVDKAKVPEGESVTLTVTPNAGYTASVTLNGAPVTLTNNAYTATNVTANQTFVVTFTDNAAPVVTVDPTTLSVSVGGSGTVTMTATDADGDAMTYTVAYDSAIGSVQPSTGNVPATGVTLTYTAVATEEATDTMTITVTDAKGATTTATVDVTITKGKIIITPPVVANATITPASIEVEEGGSATFTVTPLAGYEIQSVTVDGVVMTLTANGEFTIENITEVPSIVVLIIPDVLCSSADQDRDYEISLSELLRVQQLYITGAYHCNAGSEDGYAPGSGDTSCTPHTSDYNDQDWTINLSEFLRITQFYNLFGYHVAPTGVVTEDGFVAGP